MRYWEPLKTALAVVLLSGLIWFYADQANRNTYTLERVPVELKPGMNQAAEIVGTSPTEVTIRFDGPNSQIDQLREKTLVRQITAVVALPSQLGPGRHPISLMDLLRVPEADDLQIVEVRPATLLVDVDRYVVRRVGVSAQLGPYKPKALTIDPPHVTVRLRQSQLAMLGGGALPSIEAILEPRLRGQPPDKPLTFAAVPLERKLGGVTVEPNPPAVAVNVTIERRTETKVLKPVAVKFNTAMELWNRYQVKVKDDSQLRLEVAVRGPIEQISNLTVADVRAWVEITSEDAGGGSAYRARQVEFQLPLGVTLDQDEPPKVEFRLEERPGASPSG